MERKTYTEHLFRIGKKYKRVTPEGPEEYRRVAEKVYNSLKNIEFELEDGLYFDASIGDQYLRNVRPQLAKYEPGERPAELLDLSLYGGNAGIVYYLLNLYQLTEDKEVLKTAKEALALICRDFRSIFTYQHISVPDAKNGFYFGIGGVGSVIMIADDVIGDPLYRKTIEEIVDYLDQTKVETEQGIYWGHQTGLIGDPGVILFLLEAAEKYQLKKAKELALRSGDYIETYREETPYGIKCDTKPLYGSDCPNYVYGPSGTGFVLTRLYEVSGEEKYLALAKELAEYLMNLAVQTGDGKLIPYILGEEEIIFYVNACHGPAGTGRFFYTLYRATGEAVYHDFSIELCKGVLATGAPTVQGKTLWNNVTYCCGAAGLLHYFISLYITEQDAQYLELAKTCGEIILGEKEEDEQEVFWPTAFARIDPRTVDVKYSFYDGSTGIATSLIELYLLLTGQYRIHRLADDPFPEIR